MISKLLRLPSELALVLALYVALGIFYSLTTPLFEAPDEQLHFAFVQYLATGHGLPVQTIDTPTHLARQEGSQPPLYYLLAAATTFWIDTSDYPGIVWDNPHYGFNVPGIVDDNKNLFIHTSLESFPYSGAVLAIHLARLVSVLMGALAVLFTYLLTLEILLERRYLAASAAALVAFVPQFLFISSAVSNDSTIVALSALSLWLMVRVIRSAESQTEGTTSPAPQWRDVIALGAATGLAALAKVSGAGLIPLAGLVLVYACLRTWRAERGPLKRTKLTVIASEAKQSPITERAQASWPKLKRLAACLGVFGAVVFLFAGWWYVRNLLLYDELTGTAMMTLIFGARLTPLTLPQLLVQLAEVWETFWVGFGWGNIRANPAIYTLLEIVVAASAAGLLLGIARRRNHLRETLSRSAPLLVLVAWIVIALVELLNWMETTQAPHGRLFFPALPALAPIVLLGLVQWAPQRAQPLVARGAAVVLLGFALIAPFAILEPAYAFPPFLNEPPALSNRVDINYDDKMKLLGYELVPDRVRPGEWATLTLYWQSLATMDQDYSIGIHVVDASGRVISARDSYPGHGLLPTRVWRAGQILRDAYWLPISGDAAVSSIGWIQVTLYSQQDRRDLPAHDSMGNDLPTPIVGRLKVSGPTPAVPPPQNATEYVFGRQIDLIGYDVNLAKAEGPAQSAGFKPSQGLDLTLYWKRAAPIDVDYTVFVHVLDAGGKIVAQRDIQPSQGDRPTSFWDEGEIIPDRYNLTMPPGTYRIELGLYRADNGQRLQVTEAHGDSVGDHVMLSVEVGK